MIRKLLIANRGEIALRIMRTCDRLGIDTVAIYSDADREAPHARFAGEALHIGPTPAAQSYLRVDAILEAARRSGADALHPGYGFLSENPALPEACAAAGLTFVGPSAEAMQLVGDKVEARRIAEAEGVPVLPGFASDGQGDASMLRRAGEIGFPVMVKAAAGGGGRGMRLVPSRELLPEALTGARAEAKAAFGDERLLLERAVAGGRHIEVQILADADGNAIHLGERDCSIQRRHQKVIEESPAPGLASEHRERLCASALKLAQAAGYTNAGTVEFLIDRDGAFYFLEMNARLQVEHGVTELVTGMDLVELQLRIAAGEALPLSQDDVSLTGHAIECRVYAENPSHGYLPSSGRLTLFRPPEGEGVRNDIGVEEGTEVSTAYDPLLGKLLVHASSREEAVDRARRVLATYAVEGVKTNLGLLQAVIRDPAFARGDANLETLERMPPDEFVSRPPDGGMLAAAAGMLAAEQGVGSDPWQSLGPWRSGGRRPFEYLYQGEPCGVELEAAVGLSGAWSASIDGTNYEITAAPGGSQEVLVRQDGSERRWIVVQEGAHSTVTSAGEQYVLTTPAGLSAAASFGTTGQTAGTLRAPLPGIIARVLVEVGDRVTQRQPVVVLEAMKMEHIIESPLAGVVKSIACRPGARVAQGAVLVEIESEEA